MEKGSGMRFLKNIKSIIRSLADGSLALFIYPAGYFFKAIREHISKLPLCRRAFMRVGVFPITDHYSEPLFDSRKLVRPLDRDRDLPGIDWNTEGQLAFLSQFCFNEEIRGMINPKSGTGDSCINNDSFSSGDSEYWYNIIRLKKPARIFEIGSGNSTRMARKAIRKNQEENPGYECKHVCIEPYEKPWLEFLGVTVIRRKVEDIGLEMFTELQKDDILFIDSSHIIRPQGDVLFEYLQLLPSLKKGVIVHIHDIFSPKDYLKEWVTCQVKFWNEQYLLEAFLTNNRDWKIIGALNYLHHHHYERLREKCPFLTKSKEPGSFYIEKVT